MNKPTLKERFQYWFDNRMSKGSLSLIKLLLIATVAVMLLVAGLILLLGFNEGGDAASTLWDSFATIVNAWMPYYEDGNMGYLIFMSIGAVFGILFTSVLIGIFSTAIEEKIDSLKKGNSMVLEQDHYVILGFRSGDHTLIHQLILAAAGEKHCIVVAGDMEKEEMDQNIRDNVDIPRNIRLICRTIDIFNPAEVEKCSIAACKSVIISPIDDLSTAKVLLAVTGLIRSNPNSHARIAAIVSSQKYQLPENITRRHNVSLFHTNEVLARIIAHTSTQLGLCQTFEEIFSFEGSEMHIVSFPGVAGKSFLELSCSVDNGVPIGLYHPEHGILMSPDYHRILTAEDRVILFAEHPHAAKLTAPGNLSPISPGQVQELQPSPVGKIVILGCNEVTDTVILQLPEQTRHLVLADLTTEEYEQVERRVSHRPGLQMERRELSVWDDAQLLSLVEDAAHIIILNRHGADHEQSDMHCMMQVLKLRDLRERHGLGYNITAELHDEGNMQLVATGHESTDYIVASNMTSLLLAQLAEHAELYAAFQEILSNEGNELYLKSAGDLLCAGDRTCGELRAICLYHGYVFLGYNRIQDQQSHNYLNPGLTEEIHLEPEDRVIVMGYN